MVCPSPGDRSAEYYRCASEAEKYGDSQRDEIYKGDSGGLHGQGYPAVCGAFCICSFHREAGVGIYEGRSGDRGCGQGYRVQHTVYYDGGYPG